MHGILEVAHANLAQRRYFVQQLKFMFMLSSKVI
jgi:hypothetical protein